jgi:hypothetical protein
LAIFALSLFVSTDNFQKVLASPGTLPLSGYAWSSNIGWISFNGATTDGNTYGVYIDDVSGNLSGYAWSSNIGWIDFSPTSGFPEAPNYGARINIITSAVTGWAKALSAISADGWDGWINMNGVTSAYDAGVNKLTGFAWGDEVVGWVFFSGVTYPPTTPPLTPPNAPNGLTADVNAQCERIKLQWIDNSDNETVFKIYREVNGGSMNYYDSVGANIIYYFDSNVAPENSYVYKISAYNSIGESGYSNLTPPVSPISCVAAGLTATLIANPASGQAPLKSQIRITDISGGAAPYEIFSTDCEGGNKQTDNQGDTFSSAPVDAMECLFLTPKTYTVSVIIKDKDGKQTTPPATVQVYVKSRGIIEI